MPEKPDILLIMSDQHAAFYTGHEGGIVETPNIDAIAAEGTRFANHYTSCPLCVPARMSFLTGRLPTKIGVTSNTQTIAETTPTFLFPLVSVGYETVLIGRMHFRGKDLRHGFTKRFGGDMTSTCWAPQWKEICAERGQKLVATFSTKGCLDLLGAGESPVRHYDSMVVQTALDYLASPHEKPQFIVVGTFGPHFPYVADEKLYKKYKNKAYLPPTFDEIPDYVMENPWLHAHCKQVDNFAGLNAVAAYCALIEECDRNVGKIISAFKAYSQQNNREIIYGYISDHGDTVGARHMYGKQTFFEDSARIPFLLAGCGIPQGKTVDTNTSIMDVGSTLCELAGTRYEGRFVDGISLVPHIKNGTMKNFRPVISQFIESHGGGQQPYNDEHRTAYGVMVRRGKWKYVEYHGAEDQAVLIDVQADPNERKNLAKLFPQIRQEMHELAIMTVDPRIAEMEHQDRETMFNWLQTYERVSGFSDQERWKDNPVTARGQNIVP